MSKHDFVPPGRAPAAPAAGWYPDPGAEGQARFWDGQSWTDHVALPPGPPMPLPLEAQLGPSRQGSSFGPVFFIAMGLVLLAAIISALAFFTRQAGPATVGGVADDACRYFVTTRLQAPASAKFIRLQTIAPVSGQQWTVTGSVRSQTGTGKLRRTDFSCTVEPDSDGWRLVALRFPRT